MFTQVFAYQQCLRSYIFANHAVFPHLRRSLRGSEAATCPESSPGCAQQLRVRTDGNGEEALPGPGQLQVRAAAAAAAKRPGRATCGPRSGPRGSSDAAAATTAKSSGRFCTGHGRRRDLGAPRAGPGPAPAGHRAAPGARRCAPSPRLRVRADGDGPAGHRSAVPEEIICSSNSCMQAWVYVHIYDIKKEQ